jgi:hypothetical protein
MSDPIQNRVRVEQSLAIDEMGRCEWERSGGAKRFEQRAIYSICYKLRKKPPAEVQKEILLAMVGIGCPLSRLQPYISDAAARNDGDLFFAIARAAKGEGETKPPLERFEILLLLFWDAPGLSHWADSAAHAFMVFITENSNLTFQAYVQRRKRLGLRLERPQLVKRARCDWDSRGNPHFVQLEPPLPGTKKVAKLSGQKNGNHRSA